MATTLMVISQVCLLLALILTTIFALTTENPTAYHEFIIQLSGPGIALLGIMAALVTYFLTKNADRRANKKQHTITLLLETRLSDGFNQLQYHRKSTYPPGTTIDPKVFNADIQSKFIFPQETLSCRRKGAEALVVLLDHYETLAVALEQGDLEFVLLKNSIRGNMCRLVDDARYVIANARRKNPRTFEHLVRLYDDWRDPDATGVDGKLNERPVEHPAPPMADTP